MGLGCLIGFVIWVHSARKAGGWPKNPIYELIELFQQLVDLALRLEDYLNRVLDDIRYGQEKDSNLRARQMDELLKVQGVKDNDRPCVNIISHCRCPDSSHLPGRCNTDPYWSDWYGSGEGYADRDTAEKDGDMKDEKDRKDEKIDLESQEKLVPQRVIIIRDRRPWGRRRRMYY